MSQAFWDTRTKVIGGSLGIIGVMCFFPLVTGRPLFESTTKEETKIVALAVLGIVITISIYCAFSRYLDYRIMMQQLENQERRDFDQEDGAGKYNSLGKTPRDPRAIGQADQHSRQADSTCSTPERDWDKLTQKSYRNRP